MSGRGLILGIESSCDETAAAVVARGARTLSSVVASQIKTHARYGGVVPELASREHLRAQGLLFAGSGDTAQQAWQPVIAEANGINTVAVTGVNDVFVMDAWKKKPDGSVCMSISRHTSPT